MVCSFTRVCGTQSMMPQTHPSSATRRAAKRENATSRTSLTCAGEIQDGRNGLSHSAGAGGVAQALHKSSLITPIGDRSNASLECTQGARRVGEKPAWLAAMLAWASDLFAGKHTTCYNCAPVRKLENQEIGVHDDEAYLFQFEHVTIHELQCYHEIARSSSSRRRCRIDFCL